MSSSKRRKARSLHLALVASAATVASLAGRSLCAEQSAVERLEAHGNLRPGVLAHYQFEGVSATPQPLAFGGHRFGQDLRP